ncbi:nucleotidyl transferase AbiEii/AbiGii toxin family protein [Candidatus Micrarchaeota archaeon]|nr:nucleotidyl transferase AbiEii/AbiGii toxin family protein [Candidatus Micrarchaeota archaeon]
MNKKVVYESGMRIGLSKWQIDKDYLQHLFLRKLYMNEQSLIFKGGTCLQKVYGLPKFSRDLDFNVKGDFDIENICYDLDDPDIILKSKKVDRSVYSINYLFEYESPVFKNTLTIQISLREKTIRPPTANIISPVYQIPPYTVIAMDINEILSEKIRALFTRGFPRDLYDVWYLTNRKMITPDIGLINLKFRYIKQKFDVTLLIKKITKLEIDWDKEMSVLLPAHPHFHEVLKDIKSVFGLV